MTTQTASIEDLYNRFMQAHSKNRPVNENEKDMLAALAASADLANTKWIVTRGFKATSKNYLAGEVYPVEIGDRAAVIRLCKAGYILPEEEYKRGQDYTANKAKAEHIKNLYRDMENARADVPKAARSVDQARLELATAEGVHQDAVKNWCVLKMRFCNPSTRVNRTLGAYVIPTPYKAGRR